MAINLITHPEFLRSVAAICLLLFGSFPLKKICLHFAETLSQDDALYASYFWWRDYYEVRNRAEDRAQAYCDLCARLNNPKEPPKIYTDMYKWWVSDSNCRKFSPPRNT